MILLSFVAKATLDHNIEYWGAVKSWTIFLLIIGLILTGAPIFEKIENSKPQSFKLDPWKWTLYGIKMLLALIVTVAITVKMEHFAIWTNEKIKCHYLSKETVKTEGMVVGSVSVPYTVKYRTSYERFFLIEYSIGSEVIQQGLKPGRNVKIGRKLRIRYSTVHPSIFRVE